jgi:hypothetical protein
LTFLAMNHPPMPSSERTMPSCSRTGRTLPGITPIRNNLYKMVFCITTVPTLPGRLPHHRWVPGTAKPLFSYGSIMGTPIIPGNTGQLKLTDYNALVDALKTAQNQSFKDLQNLSMPITSYWLVPTHWAVSCLKWDCLAVACCDGSEE